MSAATSSLNSVLQGADIVALIKLCDLRITFLEICGLLESDRDSEKAVIVREALDQALKSGAVVEVTTGLFQYSEMSTRKQPSFVTKSGPSDKHLNNREERRVWIAEFLRTQARAYQHKDLLPYLSAEGFSSSIPTVNQDLAALKDLGLVEKISGLGFCHISHAKGMRSAFLIQRQVERKATKEAVAKLRAKRKAEKEAGAELIAKRKVEREKSAAEEVKLQQSRFFKRRKGIADQLKAIGGAIKIGEFFVRADLAGSGPSTLPAFTKLLREMAVAGMVMRLGQGWYCHPENAEQGKLQYDQHWPIHKRTAQQVGEATVERKMKIVAFLKENGGPMHVEKILEKSQSLGVVIITLRRYLVELCQEERVRKISYGVFCHSAFADEALAEAEKDAKFKADTKKAKVEKDAKFKAEKKAKAKKLAVKKAKLKSHLAMPVREAIEEAGGASRATVNSIMLTAVGGPIRRVASNFVLDEELARYIVDFIGSQREATIPYEVKQFLVEECGCKNQNNIYDHINYLVSVGRIKRSRRNYLWVHNKQAFKNAR